MVGADAVTRRWCQLLHAGWHQHVGCSLCITGMIARKPRNKELTIFAMDVRSLYSQDEVNDLTIRLDIASSALERIAQRADAEAVRAEARHALRSINSPMRLGGRNA